MESELNSREISKKKTRGKWPFIILGSIVLVFVIGWSVFWIILSNYAEKVIESTLAEYSKQGLNLNCQELVIGGYPFRISAICKSPTIGGEKETIVMVNELRGVALIYNPRHFIFEVDSPATILLDSTESMTAKANWNLIQASINFADLGFSVVLDSVKFSSTSDVDLLSVGKLEAHARFQDKDELTGFDFSLNVREFVQNLGLDGVEVPSEIDFGVHIPVDKDFLLVPGHNLFAKFIDQGGEVQLHQARVKFDEIDIDFRGNLNFNQERNLSGNLILKVVGIDRLLEFFVEQDTNQFRLLSTLLGGIASKDINGVSTAEIPIEVEDGYVTKIGIFPVPNILRFPPLPKDLFQDLPRELLQVLSDN